MADFNINRRLKRLIEEHYKVSPVEFSKKYEDPKAVKTYNILSERNGVSNKMLDIIIEAYPEINRSWLLTGEGEMLKKEYPKPPTKTWKLTEPITDQNLKERMSQLEECVSDMRSQLKELNDSNSWYRQTIDKLLAEREEKKAASDAPAADAECAVAG